MEAVIPSGTLLPLLSRFRYVNLSLSQISRISRRTSASDSRENTVKLIAWMPHVDVSDSCQETHRVVGPVTR